MFPRDKTSAAPSDHRAVGHCRIAGRKHPGEDGFPRTAARPTCLASGGRSPFQTRRSPLPILPAFFQGDVLSIKHLRLSFACPRFLQKKYQPFFFWLVGRSLESKL